jgi:hypothetical protein
MRLWLLSTIMMMYSSTGIGTTVPSHLLAHADSTDRATSKSHQKLSAYLAAGAHSDEEKILIFSYWIAKNIRYDKAEMKWLKRSNKTAYEVLQNRKAVCEGMANLFEQMCANENIVCYTITGHAYGSFLRRLFNCCHMRHAWNVVYVSGQWKPVDVTWCGHLVKDGNFRKNPDLAWVFDDARHFAQSHLPGDPRWQLLANPFTEKEFWHQDIPSEKNFNYQDSLNILLQRDDSQNKLISIQSAYLHNQDHELYFRNLIDLGWDHVGGSYDSLRIQKGIEIFNFALAEHENIRIPLQNRHFDNVIKTGIRTGRHRLQSKS